MNQVQSECRSLPEVDPDEIRWRFHLSVGVMIHSMIFDRPLTLAQPAPHSAPGANLARVLRFTAAGFRGEDPA